MKLILLYGPPAVGKLTVSKAIAEQSKDSLCGEIKIFHNQMTVDVVSPIIPFGEPIGFRLNGQMRMLMYEACAELEINLVTTLVYSHPEDYGWVEKIMKTMNKFDSQVYCIRLKCSVEELFNRIGNEDRKEYRKLTNPEGLQKSLKIYNMTEEMPNTFAEFDTEESTPESIAKEIFKLICK